MKKAKEEYIMSLLNSLINCYREDPKLTRDMLVYYPHVRKFLKDTYRNYPRAEVMFEKLGFTKNTSTCYTDTHILYERYDDTSKDIFTVEFTDGYFVYTSTFRLPLKTYGSLLKAITQQMIELGWYDERN